MKDQSEPVVNHNGKTYDLQRQGSGHESISFLDLWRYASREERAATAAAAALATCCSAALLGMVLIYGELTSLFVQRHTAAPTTPHAHILTLFGGGKLLGRGNRTLHMEALVQDSVAFVVASAAIMALQLASAALAITLANCAASSMVTRLRIRLLSSVISQEIAFFDTNTTMNFSSVITEDMEKLRAGTGEHVVMTSYLVGTVVLGCGVALSYGWELTLVGLSVVPVAVLVAALVAKYQTKLSAKEVVAYGKAGRIVQEVLTAIRTVRAYGGEDLEVGRYQSALRAARRHAGARGACAGAGAGLGCLLTYSMNAIVFAYGAILCVRDMNLPPEQQHYHPGIMVSVMFSCFIAAENISMCQPHLEIFSSARGAAESLFKLLERKSQINALDDKGIKPETFRGDISFENVYFNYPSRADVKVVRGLTLKVRAGETVALVGTSGCGKSTLLQLMQRAYEPESGSITLDGHPLSSLHLHHYRRSIGVVGQEPVLFSGTIRENITFGMDNVSEEEVVAAARAANAHHFITKLVNGYSTELGERGNTLSGGQRQRVALARALVRKPTLLLLDEPTAALDATAERQVQAALDAARKGRTTLVISHRLSTIVNADRIVYMEQGAVVEHGSHAELITMKGHYWKLVNEDLTTKSIASALSSVVAEDDDDEVEEVESAVLRWNSMHRSVSRQSVTMTKSMSYEGVLRDSRRIVSASSVHIPNFAMPDLINYQEPEETVEEESEAAVSTWALLKLNREEWLLLAVGGISSFLIGATMPIFAFLFSKLYGMFAWSDGERILEESRVYAGAFAVTAALGGLVTFLQAWLFNLAGSRLTDRLRENCFRKYLAQEQGWFDNVNNAVGALCARLGSDCAAVQGATGTRLGTVMQGVSTMVIGVILAMVYSWKMTLVSLLSVPCVIGGIYLEGHVNKRAEVRERWALEQASRIATETLLNIRTVQSLGMERVLVTRYQRALEESAAANAGVRRVRGLVYGLCLCAPTLGYAVSLSYGGYLIATEGLDYEYAILVSEALIYGAWLLAEALSFAPDFAAAQRSGGRILQALAREPLITSEVSAKHDPTWTAAGEVKLEDVQFRYPTRPTAAVLRGLTVCMRAGETLALVGASGCGKSTLMQLLLRNYDPLRGHVVLDSRDIRRDLTLETLRKQLGLVQQEPVLFERTLRENIAYGDNSREVSLDDIISAARQANVHDFIAGLPLGYETMIGESGASLSGGQKQRVAIARALVRNPRVLLLDEATSALDASSEKSVQVALEEASKDRTTIVIAHRLATVRHAHTICVLNKGVVAESGSHDQLVQRRGLYWELLHQQTQAPTEATPTA